MKDPLKVIIFTLLGFILLCVMLFVFAVVGLTLYDPPRAEPEVEKKVAHIKEEQRIDYPGYDEDPLTIKLGESLQVGNLLYTVNSVTENNYIHDQYFNDTAGTGATYKIINITIENVGSTSEMIDVDLFKLEVGNMLIDPLTTIVNVESSFHYDQLSPSLSRTGVVYFEIPADTEEDINLIAYSSIYNTEYGIIEF